MAEEYFAKLIGSKPIRYGLVDGKGKALISCKTFGPGEPIFSEKPYVAMQHIANQALIQSCENCHVTVGSIEEQLAHILHVEPAAVPKMPEALQKDVHNEGKCACACGAVYCSPVCRSDAWERYHCLLCTAHPDTPMHDFFQHATDTNEIFILAAQVIARVLVQYAKTSNVELARQPVDMFCKLPWWEVVTSTADLEEGQTMEEYCDIFRHLLEQTFAILMDGLQFNIAHLEIHEPHPDEDSDFMTTLSWTNVIADCTRHGIINVDFFARIVGMFEMNNISMEVRHPLSHLAELHEDTDNAVIAKWLSDVQTQVHAQVKIYQDDDDEEEVTNEDEDENSIGFPDMDGTALFSLICTMNHSCEPNVAVCYESSGLATAVALTPIKVGDELNIAYIETEQDVEARAHDLSEYKFECHCPRCIAERE
ncbi:hypothetical protein THRCLA_00970 [Thraustotheca clavata]|uniref:SET domain-containing protein n=1 Tax=Thraustotheca clavata TaxID=74557 RepID=A0A1W0A9P2_9STRA|nr:hypothetical protein THRCLA_00970 [Thraustotheca clavata]